MSEMGYGIFTSPCGVRYVSHLNDIVTYLLNDSINDASIDERNWHTILQPWNPQQISRSVRLLEDGFVGDIFDEITQICGDSTVEASSRSDLLVMFLVCLCMRLGVRLQPEMIHRARRCAYILACPFYQLQVLTATDEYRNNGIPWVFEDRCYGEEAWELENYKIGRGMGHSYDDPVFPFCYSKNCMNCGAGSPTLICPGCGMFRYCHARCAAADQQRHLECCGGVLVDRDRFVTRLGIDLNEADWAFAQSFAG